MKVAAACIHAANRVHTALTLVWQISQRLVVLEQYQRLDMLSTATLKLAQMGRAIYHVLEQ
jgi:hypothetical protein